MVMSEYEKQEIVRYASFFGRQRVYEKYHG